jgi:hypothetical protein
MRFQELDDVGIPEVGSEEELSEIDIPTEIKFWNFVFCVGLISGLILGCWAIVSNPELLDENPEVFFFTLFYISVEIGCTVISFIAFLCFWSLAYLRNKPVMFSDYIGILSVCSFTLSNLAHLLAIPIGCLLLAWNPVLPIPFKTFICFQIIFAIFILGKCFFNRNGSKSTINLPAHHPAIVKATVEIENIRSRGNSQHSVQSSFQGGREFRSTSNYEAKKKEEDDEHRERSVSTGTKLSIKTPKLKFDE